ncbi:MAG: pilin [Egibacteraceae bacterium]
MSAVTAQANGLSLDGVIDRLRNLLTGLATRFLTIGGVRYLTAAADRRQIERAQQALHSAEVGYKLAVLASMLVEIPRQVVADDQYRPARQSVRAG